MLYQEEAEFAVVVVGDSSISTPKDFLGHVLETSAEPSSEGNPISVNAPHSVEVDPSIGFPVETETILDIPSSEEVPGDVVDTPTVLSSEGEQISAETQRLVNVDPTLNVIVESGTIVPVHQNVGNTVDGE